MIFLKQKIKKRWVILSSGLVALTPMMVSASILPSSQDIANGFYDFFAGIVAAILKFFGGLIALAMELVQWAFTINQFKDIPVVLSGWKITLGLVDVFFGLGLLVIAFSTVLGLDSYGMKKTLPRLIIVALLINFSLTICGLIIDFSQVLTLYFLAPTGIHSENFGAIIAQGLSLPLIYAPTYKVTKAKPKADSESGGGGSSAAKSTGTTDKAVNATQISKMTQEDIQKTFAKNGHPNWSNLLIVLLAGITIELIAALTLAAAAFFLIVRLIMLWALVIVVPLAWFAWIFPETQSYCSDWWKSFLKWVTFAPVYAFFFYLACLMVESGVIDDLAAGKGSAIATIPGQVGMTMGPILSSPVKVLQYILVIGFLLGGLIFAEKSGVYGASWTMNLVRGTGKWAKDFTKERISRVGHWTHRKAIAPVANRLAEKAGKVETEKFSWRHPFRTAQLGKRLGRKTLLGGAGILSPKERKEAYQEWRKKEEAKIYPEMKGSIYDAMNKAYSREESHHKDLAFQRELAERLDEEKIIPYDATQRIADAHRAVKEKDWRSLSTKLLYLTSNNDLNAWFKSEWDGNKELFDKLGIKHYDSESLGKYLNYALSQAGTKEEEKAQILSKISEIAYTQGNMAPVAWSEYKDNRWQALNPDKDQDRKEHINTVNAMIGPMAGRKLITNIHPDSLVRRDQDFNPVGISSLGGSLIIQNISEEWAKEYNHARTNTKEALASPDALKDLKKIASGDEKQIREVVGDNSELIKKAQEKSEMLQEFYGKVQEAIKGGKKTNQEKNKK